LDRAAVVASVSAFTVDRHRRGHHEFLYLWASLDDLFQQNRGAEIVRANVATDLVHRLAHTNFRRLVVNNIYSFERALDQIGVANVTFQKLGVRIEVLRTSIAVNLFDDGVQNSDTMTLLDQCIDNMRADEAGASRNQYVHSFPSIGDLCDYLKTLPVV
jgi:hypothetical protein